jgi:hypothetical protein
MSQDYDELDPEGRDEERTRDRLLESMDGDKQVAELRDLLQDERMRDFLWRVLEQAGIYRSIYQKSHGDMSLLEGKRQMGLWLISVICAADPNAEMLMRQKAIAVAYASEQKERTARQRPKPQP